MSRFKFHILLGFLTEIPPFLIFFTNNKLADKVAVFILFYFVLTLVKFVFDKSLFGNDSKSCLFLSPLFILSYKPKEINHIKYGKYYLSSSSYNDFIIFKHEKFNFKKIGQFSLLKINIDVIESRCKKIIEDYEINNINKWDGNLDQKTRRNSRLEKLGI